MIINCFFGSGFPYKVNQLKKGYPYHHAATGLPKANIGHFLLDDMLIDVVAQVVNQNLPEFRVQRTVANLHSSLGAAGVKRFQEDFVSTVFESPTIFMGVDEVYCFESVILSAHPRLRTGGFEELLGARPGKPWPFYSPGTMFRQLRAHYHLTTRPAQFPREPTELRDGSEPAEVLLDARPGATRRTSANAEDPGPERAWSGFHPLFVRVEVGRGIRESRTECPNIACKDL